MKLYQQLARSIDARQRCIDADPVNDFGLDIHEKKIEDIEALLPSGSGINTGTKVDIDRSTGQKLILFGSYDVMAESGMYTGVIDFEVIVKPDLMFDFDIRISGKFGKHQDIKEYLDEVYYDALRMEYDQCISK